MRPGVSGRPKPSSEAEQQYKADVTLAGHRAELLDAARDAEARFREAQTRRAPDAEVRRLAEDFDAALTAAMRAAYAAQRAEIGPRGYDDRIYRRKAKATPRVHALTAEAEHLLTLRETHRLNGIPAVAYDPAPLARPGPLRPARSRPAVARLSLIPQVRNVAGTAQPGRLPAAIRCSGYPRAVSA